MKNEETKEPKTLPARMSAFLIKFRVVILSIVGSLFVIALLLAVFLTVSQNMRAKTFSEIDSVSLAITKAYALPEEAQKTELDTIIVTLESIAVKNNKNDAGVRARMMIAEVYFARLDYEKAALAWIDAADGAPKTYTAPVCYYNAAVCFEELGATDKAVEYLNKAAVSSNFSVVPRALFSLGRIEDQRGNYDAALAFYEELVNTYPADNWTNLAQSRILALQATGLVD